MAQEIERKFIINPAGLPGCLKPTKIIQGYLNLDKTRTVRIRIANNSAFVTIKGISSDSGLSRSEWEYAIPLSDGYDLINLCTGVIDKTRYHMIHRGKLWEIDIFHGLNSGLFIAEIELSSEGEEFDIPPWVINEVTGDDRYYNSNLMVNPFQWWLCKPGIV